MQTVKKTIYKISKKLWQYSIFFAKKIFQITADLFYPHIQVTCNLWFCCQALELLWRYRGTGRFNMFCSLPTTDQPNLEGPGDTEHLIFFSTVYLYVRAADMFDTLLFILAKKLSHVTFLHVYHHAMVVTSGKRGHNIVLFLCIFSVSCHTLVKVIQFQQMTALSWA